jgi:predicted permease
MSWWKALFRRREFDSQLDTELRFHIEKLTEEGVAAGLTPEEARRRALLEFGGKEQFKEELRDLYRAVSVEQLATNFKHALRFLCNSPTFSLTVILTLALGIGANSAVFSAINAVLLRPLPFPESDRLMLLDQLRGREYPITIAPVRLEDWNRMNSTFEAITGYYLEDQSETSSVLPEKVTTAFVMPRFLQVWGVAPALGRGFTPEEERFGGPQAIVISDRYWRRRFGADPNTIGRTLRLDQYSPVIVGIMPASFLFPNREVDIWKTAQLSGTEAQNRDLTWLRGIGRLKSNVTLEQARADLAKVQSQLGQKYPASDGDLAARIRPLKDVTIGGAGQSLWILFGSVTVLLLITCTNIAALLVARTTEREREISIRFSLGGTRTAITMQLLLEAFLLASAGAAVAMGIAAGAAQAFQRLGKTLPRTEEIRLDWTLVLYSLGCAILATLLCGLLPAIRGTRRSVAGVLAQSSRNQVSVRVPLQWLLVGVQIALAVTLLVGSGLLLRSFQALGHVSPGFDPSHVLTARVSGNWVEFGRDPRVVVKLVDRTLETLRAIPGVEAAATGPIPGIPFGVPSELRIVEGAIVPGRKILALSRAISSGYFATAKIPLLAGEDCRGAGVLVNRSFTDTYLPGVQPIGRHLEQVPPTPYSRPARILGVVGDARENGLHQAPSPVVYACYAGANPAPLYLIRTYGNPMAMTETIRHKIHEIEPQRSVFDVSLLEQHLDDMYAENRLRTTLLTLFAVTAVSLACLGLYGTLSYLVSARRREVGLRIALGAHRAGIVSRFVWQGLRVSILGCIAGLGLAAAFVRVLANMLYGVSPWDASTFAGVALVVLVTGLLASLVPAARASRVEPMQVLRDE